jgi:uronate dehydrogenase
VPERNGKKKVLITGAAGTIGRTLRQNLRDRYDLRLMVHRAREEYDPGEDVVVGSVLDVEAINRFVSGCDAVVHLALLNTGGSDYTTEAMFDNYRASFNVVEACRTNGVNKLVFASTNHVTGAYERDEQPCEPDRPVRPDSYYGASKAAVEALYRYYSDYYDLSITCIRIGSFLERPNVRRNLATWLSPADMAQLTWRSIESNIPWLIVYGISGNTRRTWSIESAQQFLHYKPTDNAEAYAAEILTKNQT